MSDKKKEKKVLKNNKRDEKNQIVREKLVGIVQFRKRTELGWRALSHGDSPIAIRRIRWINVNEFHVSTAMRSPEHPDFSWIWNPAIFNDSPFK